MLFHEKFEVDLIAELKKHNLLLTLSLRPSYTAIYLLKRDFDYHIDCHTRKVGNNDFVSITDISNKFRLLST